MLNGSLGCGLRQGLGSGQVPHPLQVQRIVRPLHLAGSKALIAAQGKSLFSLLSCSAPGWHGCHVVPVCFRFEEDQDTWPLLSCVPVGGRCPPEHDTQFKYDWEVLPYCFVIETNMQNHAVSAKSKSKLLKSHLRPELTASCTVHV